ncbi:MAG: hypothetical protein ACR2FJ_09705 [Qipengyuania sp.]
MTFISGFAGAPVLLAAVSLIATPAAAADLPRTSVRTAVPASATVNSAEEVYEGHRRWRRDRVDAGDILAGVLILGGIAAVASAAKRAGDDRYRDRDYRYREPAYRYRDRPGYRYDSGSGIDRAVSMCMSEIERDARVESVDGVNRTGVGWMVSGTLYNGEGFTCRIGNDGRIEGVDYGARDAGYDSGDDRQWDDERYRSAWADVDADRETPAAAPREQEQQPAYPGGPVDGDLDEDDFGTGYQVRDD